MGRNGWAYRPDIDGLRAVAITLVLIFHGASDRLPGGFVGVDVFFVISGFLITGIIVRRQQSGSFRLSEFYAGRVRRLYPALITVLLTSLAIGFLFATTNEYRELGNETAASSLFVANVYFWLTTDYFDQDGIYPLLHLWSLGVEEQYYLAWPLLLLLLHRFRTRLFPWTVAILAVSLAYNSYLSEALPLASFFSPFARAWELMAGAVLSLTGWRLPAGRRWEAVPVVALGLIGGTALWPWHFSLFGLATFVPVVATMAIIATPESAINRLLLSASPSVLLGKISYPLYLWHWPLLAFLTMQQFGSAAPTLRIAALGLSVVLAYLTYRLIEVPSVKRHVWALLAAMVAIAGVGLFVARDGMAWRPVNRDPRRAFVERFTAMNDDSERLERETRCDFLDFNGRFAKRTLPADCTETDGKPVVLTWGDSHARALTPGLRSILPKDMAALFLATSACPPAIEDDIVGQSAQAEACRRGNSFARETIRRLRPDTLILTQMGKQAETDWRKLALWARRQGVRQVVVIGSPPQWYPSLPAVVARYHWSDDVPYIAEGQYQPVFAADADVARQLAGLDDVTYISLTGPLCPKGACLARVPGSPPRTVMVADYGHLTPEGSAYVSRTIIAPALHFERR